MQMLHSLALFMCRRETSLLQDLLKDAKDYQKEGGHYERTNPYGSDQFEHHPPAYYAPYIAAIEAELEARRANREESNENA